MNTTAHMMRRIATVSLAAGAIFVGMTFVSFGLSREIERVDVLSSGAASERADRSTVRAATVFGDQPRRNADLDPRSLKVMTYNLNHVSRGDDNKSSNDPYFPAGTPEWYKVVSTIKTQVRDPTRVARHLEEIAQFILRENPDILLLQEVDRGTPDAMWEDTARELVERTGYPYAVWGPKWTLMCGVRYVTGNAILSKFPIVEAENIALNPIDFRHLYRQFVGVHTVLQATIDIDGQKLTCLNTHLYSKKSGYDKKAEQVNTLMALVDRSPHPVIVGGDLNTSLKRLRSKRPSALDPTLGMLTHSGLIDMRGIHDADTLDYIFLRAGDRTGYLDMYKMPPVATDHFINVSLIAIPRPGKTSDA